jgi:hypothetical protein
MYAGHRANPAVVFEMFLSTTRKRRMPPRFAWIGCPGTVARRNAFDHGRPCAGTKPAWKVETPIVDGAFGSTQEGTAL